jgi:hypothetical protein
VVVHASNVRFFTRSQVHRVLGFADSWVSHVLVNPRTREREKKSAAALVAP